MSFHHTPLGRLRRVLGIGLLVLALVIVGTSFFFPPIDAEGRVLSYSFAGLCTLFGLLNLWWARRTPHDVVTTLDPDLAPAPAQARYYRRMLWLSIIACPALSGLAAYELHELEAGAVERVRLWAPLAFVYERFGYWPTVLAPCVLGVACAAVFVFQLRKLGSAGPVKAPPV